MLGGRGNSCRASAVVVVVEVRFWIYWDLYFSFVLVSSLSPEDQSQAFVLREPHGAVNMMLGAPLIPQPPPWRPHLCVQIKVYLQIGILLCWIQHQHHPHHRQTAAEHTAWSQSHKEGPRQFLPTRVTPCSVNLGCFHLGRRFNLPRCRTRRLKNSPFSAAIGLLNGTV